MIYRPMYRRKTDLIALMISPGCFVFLFGMLILGNYYQDLGIAAIFIPFGTWWAAVLIAVLRDEPKMKHRYLRMRHDKSELEFEATYIRGYSPKISSLLQSRHRLADLEARIEKGHTHDPIES